MTQYPTGTTDPGYQQLAGLYQAQSTEDAKNRQQSVQQALIDYGGIPDFTGMGVDPNLLGTDVTDMVRGLAQSSTESGLSQTFKMTKEHADNQRRIRDLLAARGMTSSGELGYQVGEEALSYKQIQYGAMRALLDYIKGANTQFATNERDRQMGLWNAQREAAIRQQDMQMQMQQAAQEQAYQAQQNAAYAAQDAAAAASDQAFYDQMYGPDTGAATDTAPVAGPSQSQLAAMAAAVPKAAGQRTDKEKALFAQFAEWRAANPNWWK